ncbi:hypothetical protein [Sphingomonas sp. 8AM]|uniref:hypothetical protein n=1 Tax=Sphingomonas sp. 8AM TaxID=2653170 RepID=UPI0012F05996|nr:hypothetical protein [Sphingomonas sp. 8AM]VXC33912.1 conserved hypothetical protein [Sphingomonas sp. 8AM]
MTPPTFHIEADAPGEFLKLTLAGDWDSAVSARFGAEVAVTLRQMLAAGTRHGYLRTLIDMKRKNVLPQTVVADFAKMVRPDSPSKRIALVFSGPLHRMQVKRIADERCALFDNVEDARAWLYAG